ncbi:hypothetical protein HZS_1905 [Henneguya salminicola]|nr:hypothetical protein HZS_1905 [Henneguya salminicola]
MRYNINNNNFNRDTVDFTNHIPLEFNIIYNLNGAHGNIGRMIIYASVEIYHLYKNYFQREFFVRVLSILWNKYKLINGQCFSKNTLEPCLDSCNYFIEFYISGYFLDPYIFNSENKYKENHPYVYAVLIRNAPTKKYNISLFVIHYESEQNIDPDIYSTAEAYPGIISTTMLTLFFLSGNIVLNKIYVCHRYTSPFCIKKCRVIPYIEYCDMKLEIVIVSITVKILIVKKTNIE